MEGADREVEAEVVTMEPLGFTVRRGPIRRV